MHTSITNCLENFAVVEQFREVRILNHSGSKITKNAVKNLNIKDEMAPGHFRKKAKYPDTLQLSMTPKERHRWHSFSLRTEVHDNTQGRRGQCTNPILSLHWVHYLRSDSKQAPKSHGHCIYLRRPNFDAGIRLFRIPDKLLFVTSVSWIQLSELRDPGGTSKVTSRFS